MPVSGTAPNSEHYWTRADAVYFSTQTNWLGKAIFHDKTGAHDKLITLLNNSLPFYGFRIFMIEHLRWQHIAFSSCEFWWQKSALVKIMAGCSDPLCLYLNQWGAWSTMIFYSHDFSNVNTKIGILHPLLNTQDARFRNNLLLPWASW